MFFINIFKDYIYLQFIIDWCIYLYAYPLHSLTKKLSIQIKSITKSIQVIESSQDGGTGFCTTEVSFISTYKNAFNSIVVVSIISIVYIII